ncbi:MAG: hypothetical protein WBP72_07575, partial [Rhodocyclaceae bacterium]
MSFQDQVSECAIGHGLRLRVLPGWQVRTDATGTSVRDPETGLTVVVFCKPCPAGAVALRRFAELGRDHLMKKLSGCDLMGDWQPAEGQGWMGRVHMISRDVGAKERLRGLYTAFILADENDPGVQNNFSVLLEVPETVFEKRADYFGAFVPDNLIAPGDATPVPVAFAAKAATRKLELHPLEPKPARAVVAEADDAPASAGPDTKAPLLRVEAPEPAWQPPQSVEPAKVAVEEHDLLLAARGQKLVIYSIALNFVFQAAARSLTMPDLLLLILGIVVTAFTVNGVLKICSGLGRSQG